MEVYTIVEAEFIKAKSEFDEAAQAATTDSSSSPPFTIDVNLGYYKSMAKRAEEEINNRPAIEKSDEELLQELRD